MPTLARPDAQLAYAIVGEGTPVLFIQGAGVAGRGWEPQVNGISDEYACLSFDNRGVGASTAGVISVDAMVDDAIALMDAVGWDRAHVVGHSIGGILAQELALRARARVRSLTLMCTFSRGREAVAPSLWLAWVGIRCSLGPRAWRRRAFLDFLLSPEQQAEVDLDEAAAHYGRFFGRDLADQPSVVRRQLAAVAKHDAYDRLPELAGIPTLVLAGADDRLARPAFNRRLAEAIPGARYHEVPNTAHGLPLSRIELTNALLRAQLESAGG